MSRFSSKFKAEKQKTRTAQYQQVENLLLGSLFDLQETVTLLYDLTNTYFEGQSKANGHAAHGQSKEKRTNYPLVTPWAWSFISGGFRRRSHVCMGNVFEPIAFWRRSLNALKEGTLLYCHSSQWEKKDQAIDDRVTSRLAEG